MPLILPKVTIGAAVNPAVVGSTFIIEPGTLRDLVIQANFLYGAGGTTVDAYIQSSLDAGASWFDIRNFHFTTAALSQIVNHSSSTPVTTAVTPGDGALANNTSVDGLLGDLIRVKYKSAGTYTGATSLAIFASGTRLRVA